MTVSGQCVDVIQPLQCTIYVGYMKKIAFTLNTCICMALFLPVLDCVEWLCTVHVYRGMKIPSTRDVGSLELRAIFC